MVGQCHHLGYRTPVVGGQARERWCNAVKALGDFPVRFLRVLAVVRGRGGVETVTQTVSRSWSRDHSWAATRHVKPDTRDTRDTRL